MNGYKLTTPKIIQPAEIIFAIAMLLIILVSFGDYYEKVRQTSTNMEINIQVNPTLEKAIIPKELSVQEFFGKVH